MQKCSIYVHWPFCKFKCPYCDFNSHVRNNVDQKRLLQAYLKEISYYDLILQQCHIKSIFFGGGTPSLAAPDVIFGIIDAILKYSHTRNLEITLEANPTSIESDKLREYKAAGVNRVSIGVQSFNQENLKFLGREHTALEAQKAISVAADTFDNYTFDLIYALPHQTLSNWSQELTTALPLIQHHISLYQLTIEKGTEFYKRVKHKHFSMPSDTLSADFYTITQEIMEKADLPRYEISNHAVPGKECIHNINYWTYGDYIGIGAGAHSRYMVAPDVIQGHSAEGFASYKVGAVNWHLPEKWLVSVEEHGHGIQNQEKLTSHAQYQERLLMGLRLTKGVSSSLIRRTNELDDMLRKGLLSESENTISVSKQYTLLTDQIIAKLLLNYEQND